MNGRTSHIGPGSCVSRREAWGEALTGVLVGQVLSHVTKTVRDADTFRLVEGSTPRGANASTRAVALWDFRFNVTNIWRRTLNWRGQKGTVTCQRMTVMQNRWLAKPRVTHPWPDKRFAVKHPRWEPGTGIPPAGICAGGAW